MEWIADEKSRVLINELKKKTANLKKMLDILLKKHGDQGE